MTSNYQLLLIFPSYDWKNTTGRRVEKREGWKVLSITRVNRPYAHNIWHKASLLLPVSEIRHSLMTELLQFTYCLLNYQKSESVMQVTAPSCSESSERTVQHHRTMLKGFMLCVFIRFRINCITLIVLVELSRMDMDNLKKLSIWKYKENEVGMRSALIQPHRNYFWKS